MRCRPQAAVFGDAYVASVAAGEAAGKLPEVLGRLAQFQRTEMRIRATVRTLLAYPILLAGVSSLVVIGPGDVRVAASSWTSSSQFEVPLPAITQVRRGDVRRAAHTSSGFGCRS